MARGFQKTHDNLPSSSRLILPEKIRCFGVKTVPKTGVTCTSLTARRQASRNQISGTAIVPVSNGLIAAQRPILAFRFRTGLMLSLPLGQQLLSFQELGDLLCRPLSAFFVQMNVVWDKALAVEVWV